MIGDEEKCWNHFKERLAEEIRQYCAGKILPADTLVDAVNKFCNQHPDEGQPQVVLKERTSSEYIMSMKSNVDIQVISAGHGPRVAMAAAGGGGIGAAVGAMTLSGVGAGAGAGVGVGIVGGTAALGSLFVGPLAIGMAIGAAIGAGIGALVGGAVIRGGPQRRDIITIPLQHLLPRIGKVETISEREMTVTVKIPSTYLP